MPTALLVLWPFNVLYTFVFLCVFFDPLSHTVKLAPTITDSEKPKKVSHSSAVKRSKLAKYIEAWWLVNPD